MLEGKVARKFLLPGSVSHPSGSISKSGHDLPSKPSAPIKLAAAKSLVKKKKIVFFSIHRSERH